MLNIKNKRQSLFLLLLISSCLLSCDTTPTNNRTIIDHPKDTICDTLISSSTSLDYFALTSQSDFIQLADTTLDEMFLLDVKAKINLESYINRIKSEHASISFNAHGINLCQNSARIHRMDNEFWINGNIPNSRLKIDQFLLDSWDIKKPDSKSILEKLKLKGYISSIKFKKCLIDGNDELKPAWDISFKYKGLPYKALSINAGEVIKAYPDFFTSTTTAKAVIYEKIPPNTKKIELKTINLTGVSSGGSLCNKYFKNASPDTFFQAYSTDRVFEFKPGETRFAQTALFTNSMKQYDYIMGLKLEGWTWPGKRIGLVAYDREGQFPSNDAKYVPSETTIYMPSGDDIKLKNLHYDDEPITHEVGHHLIYQSLNEVSAEESKSIQEGLADVFTMTRTNNTCLGELICPIVGLCISTSCLRSADNDLKIGDSDYESLSFHKKGQIISGLMWDLGKKIGIDNMAKITLKAVDFFAPNAGYANFLESVMKADKAINNGVNACTFADLAKARKMDAYLSGVDCNSFKQ